MSRPDATERRILERLPQRTLARVMDVKRLFGARARVISYLGPRPSVCKFCMEAPEELKEVYRIAVPVFQTTWSHDGKVISRKQVATLVRDTAAKWRWRGKIVL